MAKSLVGIVVATTVLLSLADGALAEPVAKKIVILAGAKSHGPEGNGAHEYPRSARLLKTMLDNVEGLHGKIVTEVHFDGWPQDPATLDDAATIMTISDGQDGDLYSPVPWMTPERIKVIEKQMARGCGFMTFHFSTFAPDDYGAKVLEWGGGYFDWQGDDGQRNWYSAIRTLDSEAKVGSPGHPVVRGLDSSFKLRDEFYYKIRFRDGDDRLKPILLVPELGGGIHDHAVAWAVARKDGGRGFCTTCGHFYDNWEHPQFRKMMLNALVWTAGIDVPEKGIDAKFYTDDEVKAHLAGEAKSIKAVIVTGHQYPGHVWRETTLAIEDALRKDPRIDIVSMPDPEFLASEKLHGYDAVVLNYCNWERPGLSDAAKENFVKYLREGGGLVIVHFANGAFHYSLPKAEDSDWPEFRKICRRVWNHQPSKTTKLASGHDAYGKFHVDIADKEHAITRGLARFETIDELYYQQDGEEPIHVLATARSKVTGNDEPMAFVYEYGNGRVFQAVLGHAAESIRTAGTAALVRRGTAWAAGKEPIAVSDDAVDTVSPVAPSRDNPRRFATVGESNGNRRAPTARTSTWSRGPMARATPTTRPPIFAAPASRQETGKVLDPAGICVCRAADLQEWPSVARHGRQFLVVWQDCCNGSDYDIYAARVIAAGKVVDPGGVPVIAKATNQARPAAASAGEHFVVAWMDARQYPNYGL